MLGLCKHLFVFVLILLLSYYFYYTITGINSSIYNTLSFTTFITVLTSNQHENHNKIRYIDNLSDLLLYKPIQSVLQPKDKQALWNVYGYKKDSQPILLSLASSKTINSKSSVNYGVEDTKVEGLQSIKSENLLSVENSNKTIYQDVKAVKATYQDVKAVKTKAPTVDRVRSANSSSIFKSEIIESKKHETTNMKENIVKPSNQSSLLSLNVFNTSISSTIAYDRKPRSKKPRTPYNDVYRYTRNNIIGHDGSTRDIAYHSNYKVNQSHLDNSTFSSSDSFNITIISQTSKERLFYLPYLLDRWKGPISITIMIPYNELTTVTTFITNSHFPSRLRLALYIHAFPNRTDCVYRYKYKKLQCLPESIYPINRLRNIAIANVQTSHFIVFDMDMWPSRNLYDTLLNLPTSYFANPYKVMIIPAFSLSSSVLNPESCKTFKTCVKSAIHHYPETKADLTTCLKKQKCTIFRPQSLTHNYLPKTWTSLPSTSQYKTITCFREAFLEPYVMVKRSNFLPYFDERFINYGFNKVQWIENLRYFGYEFNVLSHAYAIDIPHSSSDYAKKYHDGFVKKHPQMLVLYRRFLYELRHQYKDESRILLCLRKSFLFNLFSKIRY